METKLKSMDKVKVLTANHLVEAKMVEDYLTQEGFHVELRGDALSAAVGELPVNEGSPSLWVPVEQGEDAAKAVQEWFQSKTPDAPSWTCQSCGETHEGQFQSCWNCGAERPEAAST